MNRLKRNIDYRFKILYAVAMIMVVAGHCNGGGVSIPFCEWIPYNGVHLSLFIFCSGYFYRLEDECSIGQYILSKIKKLVVPLYIYHFAFLILTTVLTKLGFTIGVIPKWYRFFFDPLFGEGQLVYNMGAWFVAPLFFVEIFTALSRRLFHIFKLEIPEILYFLASMVLGAIGSQLCCLNTKTDGILNRQYFFPILRWTLLFTAFYGLGIFYRAELEKYAKKIPGIVWLSVILALKAVIMYKNGIIQGYSFAAGLDFFDGWALPLVVNVLGIMFWMRIADMAEPALRNSRIVNLIADNTFCIMETHLIGMMVVKGVFGIISKYSTHFQDFDWQAFRTDIFWYYVPKSIWQYHIIYLIAGIGCSLLIRKVIDIVKCLFARYIDDRKKVPL